VNGLSKRGPFKGTDLKRGAYAGCQWIVQSLLGRSISFHNKVVKQGQGEGGQGPTHHYPDKYRKGTGPPGGKKKNLLDHWRGQSLAKATNITAKLKKQERK